MEKIENTKTIDQLDNSTVLFHHKNLTCYAIKYAEQYPDLMQAIYAVRKLSYSNHGFNGDAMTDVNKGAKYSYQVILWDHSTNNIIAGYVLNLVNQTVETLGWDYLWLSRTFRNLEQFIKPDAPTIMLEHSFVKPDYQKISLALILVWKGVTTLVNKLFGKCYYVGLTGMPFRKYPKEVYSLYISCLRGSEFFNGGHYDVKSLFPFDETQHLSGEQIAQSKKHMSFCEMEKFISESTGFSFTIPTLLKNYTKHFNAEIIDFGISERTGSLMVLQFACYQPENNYKILA